MRNGALLRRSFQHRRWKGLAAMTPADLEALAVRIETASGPDRELDGEIEVAIERWPEGWSRDSFIENAAVEFHHVGDGRVGIRTDGGLDHVRWNAPAYTKSLDAAMSLAEDYMLVELSDIAADGLTGCRLFSVTEPIPPVEHWGLPRETGNRVEMLARAVCAARLRARAKDQA
jgi:hypothetical protein